MNVIIIGGVAGGMSAATRLRRRDENATITVLEKSGHVSFANCGLPYYIGGVIEDRKDLLLQTPESLHRRFGLDVRVRTEATAIDREAKTVTARDLDSGDELTIPYDALVLAPGAAPIRPDIPGIERALTLRDVEDTDRIFAAAKEVSSAVIIGGGFIGVELAENLVQRGIATTIVEAAGQVMAPIDPEMVAPVHRRLADRGVRLELGSGVTKIGADDVTLESGAVVPGDLVICAIGVRPSTALAEAAGLEIGERGGIAVDERLRTSDSSIYAVGDAVEKRDAISGEQVLVPLANTANLQGRTVADVIAGDEDARDRPVLATAIVGVFGLRVAATGWNEKRLRAAGRPYRAIHTRAAHHAGYYPGAEEMSLKLLVDPETDAILGAQAVGGDGVDKRIDVLATAITGGISASKLSTLELAYAPQFGSAKDPVNMLGFINENRASGMAKSIQWHELPAAVERGATVIDARSPEEHARGAIPGAINVPLDELRERAGELPDGELVVHCAVGQRGHSAARILVQQGRDAVNLDGGYETWVAGTGAAGEPQAR
ncbi:MAG: FAD-dependent oxidoreductase [Baekduia sp.]